MKVGVVSFVILSVSDIPVSDSGARSGADGAAANTFAVNIIKMKAKHTESKINLLTFNLTFMASFIITLSYLFIFQYNENNLCKPFF